MHTVTRPLAAVKCCNIVDVHESVEEQELVEGQSCLSGVNVEVRAENDEVRPVVLVLQHSSGTSGQELLVQVNIGNGSNNGNNDVWINTGHVDDKVVPFTEFHRQVAFSFGTKYLKNHVLTLNDSSVGLDNNAVLQRLVVETKTNSPTKIS